MIFTWVDYTPSKYGDYHFPAWADALGWMFTMTSVCAIPVVMIIQIARTNKKGSIIEKIKHLAKPSEEWGPAIERNKCIATTHEVEIPLNMSPTQSIDPQDVFNGTNTNLKKEDIPVNSVLTTSARVVETGLRIINTQYSDDKGLAPEAANELYIVLSHQMRTLQDKQCSLVVNKTYDPDFAKQYLAVMSGNSNMRQENVEAINMTNSVMQYRTPARSSHQQSFNGKKTQGKKNTYYKKGGYKNHDDDRSSKDDINII